MAKPAAHKAISRRSITKILPLGILGLALLIPSFPACKKGDDQLVAKVGGTRITGDDFRKEISNSPPAYQNYLTTLEGKKQFLDIILKEKILMNEAEKSGIAKHKEIQKNMKEYLARAKEQEAEFRKSLVLREFLRTLQDGDLKISEPELRNYYEENKETYENPVRVTASHILISNQAEADSALKRLKKGEDFSKLAKEVSKDPSASRGGLIGEITKGDLADLPEFESALFALKNGQVSNVVQTKIGYHIIKKNGETRLPGQPFEQAAPQIRRVLEKRKFDQWIEKARSDQKVWVDDKVLASISVQPSPEQAPPAQANP